MRFICMDLWLLKRNLYIGFGTREPQLGGWEGAERMKLSELCPVGIL